MKIVQMNLTILLLICLQLRPSISQQEQQQVLNKEMLDAIMRSVSPGCRSELESALASQSDISDECKLEIQAVVQSFANQEAGGPREESARSPPPEKKPPSVHPGIAIGVFVVVLFSAIAIYVVYINQALKTIHVEKKPKKLSKKKVEKLRQQNKPI